MSSKLKSAKKPKYIFIKLAAAILLIFTAYGVARIQSDVAKQKAKLNDTNASLLEIKDDNEQLERYSSGENLNEYMERIARDELGYTDPNERVYYVVPSE